MHKYITFYKYILYFSSPFYIFHAANVIKSIAVLLIHFHQFVVITTIMHYLLLSRYVIISLAITRLPFDRAIHFPPSSSESEKFSKRRRKLSRARTIDHRVLEAIFASNTNSRAFFVALRHTKNME